MRAWKQMRLFLAQRRDWVLACLLLLATGLFFVNGSNGDYGDLAPRYGSVRCVITGCNPYSWEAVQNELVTHGALPAQFAPPYWSEHAMLYPPLTYVLLLPLGAMSYPTAGLAYFWFSGLAFAGACGLLVWLTPPELRTVAGLGASLVLATSSVLLRLGQVSTLSLALLVVGCMLLMRQPGERTAGAICLFLGTGLKPQLALLLVLFFCLRPQTRKAGLAVLGGFIVASAAAALALTLRLGSTQWLTDLRGEMQASAMLGPAQQIDTSLVNLSALTTLLSAQPFLYQSVDWFVLLAIGGAICVGLLRGESGSERDWLAVAALCYLTVLLTYHRSYDLRIQLLALPALGILWRRERRIAVLLMACGCLLLFSRAIVLEHWSAAHFGAEITHKLLFRIFVERQQAVVLLLATGGWAAVLLMRSRRRLPAAG